MSSEKLEGLDLEAPSLLDWLSGETLYSLCARQHQFWGHSHPSRTASILFAGRQAGFQHDLPGHLAALSQRTKGAWGAARLVAENRTLLRFFRPFLDAARYEDAITAMLSRSVRHLKFNLGLLTSNFRANHPLKACRECIKANRAETGWSPWHLEHQLPGVWVCLRHDTDLLECALKSTGVSRFDWVLPSSFGEWLIREPPSAAEFDRRKRLAEMTVGVVAANQPAGWLSTARIQGVLLRELRSRGMATVRGQLRLKIIAAQFIEHAQAFQGVRELDGLSRVQKDAEVQLGRLLRPMRTGTHPLRFLVLIDWLFPHFAAFQQAFNAIDNELSWQDGMALEPKPSADEQFRCVVTDRIRSGESPSAVARTVGIDVATARSWAAAEGITTNSRPSVLHATRLKAVVRDLERGVEVRKVAQANSLSRSTISRVLRTTVGLHERWRLAHEAAARASRRAEWLEGRESLPQVGPKLLRASMPAVYSWLYRNDRTWLAEHSPEPMLKKAQPSRIRWDKRDLNLRAAVQEAVLRLSEARPGRMIHLWQVYQAVPELKAKLLQLEKLPLTKATLEQALGARRPVRKRLTE